MIISRCEVAFFKPSLWTDQWVSVPPPPIFQALEKHILLETAFGWESPLYNIFSQIFHPALCDAASETKRRCWVSSIISLMASFPWAERARAHGTPSLLFMSFEFPIERCRFDFNTSKESQDLGDPLSVPLNWKRWVCKPRISHAAPELFKCLLPRAKWAKQYCRGWVSFAPLGSLAKTQPGCSLEASPLLYIFAITFLKLLATTIP